MTFLRKAGNMLGRTASNYLSQEISSSKPCMLQAIRWMSSSKLFIGGLSYSTDDMSLREAFSKHGDVAEARVIVDRESGRSRGFGFVTFASVEEASAAIQALDQQELHGRRIRVDYANDRVRGYGSGSFSGGSFGGGSFGGGGGSYGSGGGYNSNYGGGSNSYPRDDGYGSGIGSQGSTNYANNSYGGNQSFGVAGGGGGSDNSYSGGAGGYEDKFGGGQTDYGRGADEGFGKDDSLNEEYGDAPNNHDDRRS